MEDNTINPYVETDETKRRGRKPRDENAPDGRSNTFNYAKEEEGIVKVGGMEFRKTRAVSDYSDKTTLDIPRKLLNPDLNYRWVNDDENGRVDKLKGLGYQPVDSSHFDGVEISTRRRVGLKKDGTPLYSHLMALPKKWHEERQKSRDQVRSARERGLISGKLDANGASMKDDKIFGADGSLDES